jgi:hypothetical protein
MAQKDQSPPQDYLTEVLEVLDHPLGLILPGSVVATAAWLAFSAGLTATEAAIRICHEHAQRMSGRWNEDGTTASDLAEFVLVNRLDESAQLAKRGDRDLLDLLPDLPTFVRQPCFSDEFRHLVSNLSTWHGIPESRWIPAEDKSCHDEIAPQRRTLN